MKYNIHKDFRKMALFKEPFFKFAFPIENKIVDLLNLNLKSDKEVTVSKYLFESFDNYKIKIYTFEKKDDNSKKVPLIYFHGGSFITKAAFNHIRLMKIYAKEANVKVFLVDYRLAPKYPYPIGVNDCYKAYEYILNNHILFNIDNTMPILGGDSAGGMLVLNTSLKILENTNLNNPIFQMLIYPVITHKYITESMNKYTDTPIWNSKLNSKMWKYYLGDKEVVEPLDYVINIPTYIETAEFDCLHDEGIMYYEHLVKNNVKCYKNDTKQTIHGYDFILKSQITKSSINSRINALIAAKTQK